MTIKKYSLILGLLALVMTTQAQSSTEGGNEWKDSSLIPPSRMAQHNEFLNNQYIFPAKPRSQWELGLKIGSPTIAGDVSSVMPNFGFGVHARKALGYLFSVRGEFYRGTSKGLNWKETNNYVNNTAWTSNGYKGWTKDGQGNYYVPTDKIFLNHKTTVSDLSIQGIFNFTNIRFHKAEPKFAMYAIFGVGATFYKTMVDAKNAGGSKYSFNGIPNGTWDTRNDTKNAVKALLDGTYETAGESNTQAPKAFGMTARFSQTAGLGMAFKISKKVNVAIENRLSFVKDDLLDGQRYQATPLGEAVLSNSNDALSFTSIGININLF
jgi:hypothetical protein